MTDPKPLNAEAEAHWSKEVERFKETGDSSFFRVVFEKSLEAKAAIAALTEELAQAQALALSAESIIRFDAEKREENAKAWRELERLSEELGKSQKDAAKVIQRLTMEKLALAEENRVLRETVDALCSRSPQCLAPYNQGGEK